MSRNKRSDDQYEICALSKGLMVLEALEGSTFEPVPVQTVMERTGFGRDYCDRALKTLKMRGYAVVEKGKWTVGRRLSRLATSIARNKPDF